MKYVKEANTKDCPICYTGARCALFKEDRSEWEYIDCPLCGRYFIDQFSIYHAQETSVDPDGAAVSRLYLGEREGRIRGDLSAWLRENSGRDVRLTQSFFDNSNDPNRIAFDTARGQVRSFLNRADKLLLFLEKETDFAGQRLKSSPGWQARGWAANARELGAILGYLRDSNRLVERTNGLYQIVPGGWIYLEKLKEINPESQQGFVAMWFDESTKAAWLEAFKPAIEEAGYVAFRIDFKPHTNMIDNEIIAEIRRSRFLVADLTGQNGGVYYEAGFAAGLSLPVFYTCLEAEFNKRHFDIKQFNCLKWTPNTLDKFKSELRYWIEAVLGRGPARADQQAQ